MHKPALTPLLAAHLFRTSHPPSSSSDTPFATAPFAAFVAEQLVPEVRHETLRYYGHLASAEAQYPGLDYAAPHHRARLAAYPAHRRLFRALDALRCTPAEIRAVCTWEGTRAARERYERERGVRVRDSTLDGIPVAERCRSPVAVRVGTVQGARGGEGVDKGERIDHGAREATGEAAGAWPGAGRHGSHDAQYPPPTSQHPAETTRAADGEDEDDDDDDDDDPSTADVVARSVGTALQRRLLAAADAARARGSPAAPAALDPAWEQWMKEAAERGVVPYGAFAAPSAAATAAAAPPAATARAAPPSVSRSRGAPPAVDFVRAARPSRAPAAAAAPPGPVPAVFAFGAASALGETLAHVADVQERLGAPLAAGGPDAGAPRAPA